MNLENVDHDFSVSTLKATKQQVRLLIGRQSIGAVDRRPPPAVAAVAQPTPGLRLQLLVFPVDDDARLTAVFQDSLG